MATWTLSGSVNLTISDDSPAPSPSPSPAPPLVLPAGFRPFPAADPWNTDVSHLPVDPNSAALLAAIGLTAPLHPDFGALYQGATNGIPFNVVDGTKTPGVSVTLQYAEQSDPGPYPIPPHPLVEAQSDGHLLVIDLPAMKLYELFAAALGAGGWRAVSGAVWDLNQLQSGQRPAGWTAADAAGLPVFPGLVRYDEVQSGVIRHALRFTVPKTRRAYLLPANHWASQSTDATLPPMGLRVRLQAATDISRLAAPAQVIAQALKTYGMLLADNGSPWFVSGEPDDRWSDADLGTLKLLHGSDLEVVNTGARLVTP